MKNLKGEITVFERIQWLVMSYPDVIIQLGGKKILTIDRAISLMAMRNVWLQSRWQTNIVTESIKNAVILV